MNLRSRLADHPLSIGGRARQNRWQLFQELFPDIGTYQVLDLGGTAYSWLNGPVRPRAVTLLNIYDSELTVRHEGEALPDWMTLAAGDACDPPAAVLDGEYDLIFSNSLIEHVGGVARRKMLADFVNEAAPRYWVQTPYRYFPIEPHWIFPGFQFLPLAARSALSSRWPLMHTRASPGNDSIAMALDVELLSLTEMRYLFPEATIHQERFAGLTKSLVAIRT